LAVRCLTHPRGHQAASTLAGHRGFRELLGNAPQLAHASFIDLTQYDPQLPQEFLLA
jgi:hypothetical protein